MRSRVASAGCSPGASCRFHAFSIACSTSCRTDADMPNTATRKLLSSLDGSRARELCIDMLASAGITVGGSQPWDVQIHDERIWQRILRDGTLGGGESYVDGWWDSA